MTYPKYAIDRGDGSADLLEEGLLRLEQLDDPSIRVRSRRRHARDGEKTEESTTNLIPNVSTPRRNAT